LNTVQNLKYSALYKGMIIFGRIFKVTNYYIIVSLPGQISGKLQATDISESYTNVLKSIANNEKINNFLPLSDVYKEGDYLICYIKNFHFNSKKVSLSLNPYLINKNLNPRILTIGSKIILSISSLEDHGYILETGLKNLRAFLSFNDIESEIKFFPGKQITCVVKNIRIEENIFTVNVSVKSKLLDSVETRILSLDHLLPGIQYSLIIKKLLKNGLQVYYSGKHVGYINQFYLKNSLSSFLEGQEIVGRLLYITPVIKIAYFSLVSVKQEKSILKIGDIIKKAKVISCDTRGILVQLNKGIQGFIPLKHMDGNFKKIESKFFTNSIHKCRVKAYDLIAKLYICTIDKQLITEQCSIQIGLKPGDRMEVTISTINQKKKCINVLAGNLFHFHLNL
jgi:rRNA biogenesis protein RRP5